MNGYYVDLDGQTAGPFSLEELTGLYKAGTVKDDTLFAKSGAVQWLPVRALKPLMAPAKIARKGDWYCRSCGHVGPSGTFTSGSLAIEVVLWLCFLIPGLIYSLWRGANRYGICKVCQKGDIIPVESPAAREHVQVAPGLAPSWRGVLGVGSAAVLALIVWWVVR